MLPACLVCACLSACLLQPGAYRFTVGMQDIHAALEEDGEPLPAGSPAPACSLSKAQQHRLWLASLVDLGQHLLLPLWRAPLQVRC
jgi:hypothetical protein